MTSGKFVAYYRVSAQRQGKSGLGLDAQRSAVQEYLNGGNWRIVAEYTEVESGKRKDRPMLGDALKACRIHGAKLVIAKLDRLARNAHFLLGLQEAGVEFIAVDMPTVNRMVVGILALVAEDEAKRISERTKAALAAAKRRGVKLGGIREGHKPFSAKASMAGVRARVERANARAARSSPSHHRATGGRRYVTAGHCGRVECARHPDRQWSELAGNAGIEAAGQGLTPVAGGGRLCGLSAR